jgi:hypothetical protein
VIKLGYIAKCVVGLLARRVEHRFITLGRMLEFADGIAKRTVEFRLRVCGDPFELAV